MDDMDQILGEFLAETRDDMERLDEAVVAMSSESMTDLLRVLHTIKGTSSFLGLDDLQSAAHDGETLVQQLCDRATPPDEHDRAAVTRLLSSIRALLDAAAATRAPRPPTERLGTLLREGATASARDVFSALETRRPGPAATTPAVPRVGDLLIAKGLATQQDVDAAIEAQRTGDARHVGEILVDHGVVTAADVFEALNAQSTARAGAADSTVRVDVALLDELLDAVTGLAEVCDDVAGHAGHDADMRRLIGLTGRLQQGLMRARMQPIGEVFEKFPRAVRTLESLCGKQVRVEVRGAELQLDRTVIEAVKGPLTHLVRNAIGHGIETPEDRAALGKPPTGTLTLSAFEDDGLAHVQVADDGAGIDVAALRARAVDMGLLSAGEAVAMPDAAAAELLFEPGLSTAGEVSAIAGRGVGMDAVKSSVEQLSGRVSIDTVRGAGTTFTLSFPPSLALVPALIVSDADALYVIPRREIVEVFTIPREDIRGHLRWRDESLPLVRASGRTSDGNPADSDVVVVVAVGGRHVGVLAADVVDAQDLVVRPGSPTRAVRARVAVTRTGVLAAVLDAATLQLASRTHSLGVPA